MKFSNKKNNSVKKAFTMAEAILVMTILGIIATIMITTLKPAKYSDEVLEANYKRVLSEIDGAVNLMVANDSKNGTLEKLVSKDKTRIFKFGEDWNLTTELFFKYVQHTRREYKPNSVPNFDYLLSYAGSLPFYLKNGALVLISLGDAFKDSKYHKFAIKDCSYKRDGAIGMVFFDVNGEAPPNATSKDQFYVLLNKHGIDFEQTCTKEEEKEVYDPVKDTDNFVVVGSTVVAKKNPNDGEMFAVPLEAGVTLVGKDETCNTQINPDGKCCWDWEETGSHCIVGDVYSNCNRTLCTQAAAKAICDNFSPDGKKWRLPTPNELEQWEEKAKELNLIGPDGVPSPGRQYCLGANLDRCYPTHIWSSANNIYYGTWSGWGINGANSGIGLSSRCVRDI